MVSLWQPDGSIIRSNGVNTGSTLWSQDASTVKTILDTRHDAHDENIADSIEECINRGGLNTPTANLPMGGYKHTGQSAAAADGEAVIWQQHKYSNTWSPTATAGGSLRFSAGATSVGLAPIYYQKYYRIGNTVFIKIKFEVPVTVAGPYIGISLPVNASTDADTLSGFMFDATTGTFKPIFTTWGATNRFDIYRYDLTNIPASTSPIHTFTICGHYEAA